VNTLAKLFKLKYNCFMIEKEKEWKLLIGCPPILNTYQKENGKKYLIVNQNYKEITYQTEDKTIHREIKNREEIERIEI